MRVLLTDLSIDGRVPRFMTGVVVGQQKHFLAAVPKFPEEETKIKQKGNISLPISLEDALNEATSDTRGWPRLVLPRSKRSLMAGT